MNKKSINNLGIQSFIALVYAIVMVLLISLIGLIAYVVTSRTVGENTNEYVFQLVKQINFDIENYLKNVENTMDVVSADEDIINFFSESSEEALKNTRKVRNDLNAYMNSRDDVINIFLARDDGLIVPNEGDYEIKDNVKVHDASWYKDTLSNDGHTLSNAHIQNMIVNRYKWVVSWSGAMKDPYNGDIQGAVLVDLNFNFIEDLLTNISFGEKGYMFIMDEKGEIIYHPKHELIYSGIKTEASSLILNSEDGYLQSEENGRIKNYIVSTSKYTGWKVVAAVYEDELQPYDTLTRQIYVLMSALAIVLAIIISIFISKHYLHPIKDLSLGMEQFKKGDLNTRVDIKMTNEFGDLADDFNDMTVQIKSLVHENKQKEKAKRKYELKSLQAQINPHFLYNTLDSIVWMAEAEMNDDVVKMTMALSKLFRISINRGSEFVTLEQEIEHIESYLAIQKIRYGEKLDYHIEVEKSLLPIRIIKIIIQPIVENAIYHGIKKLPGNGRISISVYEEAGNICISIQDNGVGMDEDKVASIMDADGHKDLSKGGIGVKNVDQRLKLYYGEEYGVSIVSEEFVGTTLILTIPKEYKGVEEKNGKVD